MIRRKKLLLMRRLLSILARLEEVGASWRSCSMAGRQGVGGKWGRRAGGKRKQLNEKKLGEGEGLEDRQRVDEGEGEGERK